MKTDYAGIDYGLGKTNVHNETGIRFGVILMNEVSQAWCGSSEPHFNGPFCPKCGNEAINFDSDLHDDYDREPYSCDDYACELCELGFDSSDAYNEEPSSFTYQSDGYTCEQGGEDPDIFILEAPYFTYAQFCSPCAPGAGYIMNPCESGPKTYCLGHDWFDSGRAPYPIYDVKTGELA